MTHSSSSGRESLAPRAGAEAPRRLASSRADARDTNRALRPVFLDCHHDWQSGPGKLRGGQRLARKLALLRRAVGLPVTCIGWGPISDAGFLTRNQAVKDALAGRLGATPLSARAALAMLDRLLPAALAQLPSAISTGPRSHASCRPPSLHASSGCADGRVRALTPAP